MVRPPHMPPAQLRRALPAPHVKAMCAQLGLAHVQGCSRARWEGLKGEAWPGGVGEGRGRTFWLTDCAHPLGHLACVRTACAPRK